MKKICVVTILLAALLLAMPDARAQKFVAAPVEISRETTEIDGRAFYVHTVVAKQTLYSICKTYGADINEVKTINADALTGGLKTGSRLLIPMVERAAEQETLISKPEQPEIVDDGNGDTEEDGEFVLHRVKWYDSMLMLSLKYKVSQEAIMKANNMTSSSLTVGQMILIPVAKSVTITDIDDNAIIDVSEDEFEGDGDDGPKLTIIDPENESEEDWQPEFVPFSGTANVALMLPFSAKTTPSDNFLNFYAGVLMALEDLRKDGTNVNLKVIDMSDFDGAEQMFEASGLEGIDFVIGNFTPESIDEAAAWCDSHHTPLVSPLDQKIEAATYNHRYLINAQLSTATQTMRLAESIDFDPGKDNVIVLGDTGEHAGVFHQDVVQSLDSLGIPYTTVYGGIQNALQGGKTNHVIITSERESVAASAVRNVGLLTRNNNYDIIGYASHKIRRFDSIDSELFSRINAHFLMGYNVDYSDENVRNFVRRYRALYNTEPGNFAFQGYDIASYFISALKKYGNDMINGIAGFPAEGLQINFRFDRRTAAGGMFNEATKNVVY